MKHSDELPIKINFDIECQSIDINGNKCKNKAEFEAGIHGDIEIYGHLWVSMFVCSKCAKKHNINVKVKNKDFLDKLKTFDDEIIPEYGMSHNQMKELLNKVVDKSNWKNPINSFCREEDVDGLSKAITFFTGSTPNFRRLGDKIIVTADGYYKSIGA